MYTLPYRIGITTALVAAFGSIPMIFDIDTVLLFNEHYVTAGTSIISRDKANLIIFNRCS